MISTKVFVKDLWQQWQRLKQEWHFFTSEQYEIFLSKIYFQFLKCIFHILISGIKVWLFEECLHVCAFHGPTCLNNIYLSALNTILNEKQNFLTNISINSEKPRVILDNVGKLIFHRPLFQKYVCVSYWCGSFLWHRQCPVLSTVHEFIYSVKICCAWKNWALSYLRRLAPYRGCPCLRSGPCWIGGIRTNLKPQTSKLIIYNASCGHNKYNIYHKWH